MLLKSRRSKLGRALQAGATVVAAASLTVGMAGCSGGGGSGSGGSGSATGMSGKTVKMYTWIGGKPDRQQWQGHIDAGKAADPDMSVSFSGPPIGDYYTKLPTVLTGSDAPCLVTFQNGQVAPYVDGLEPLNSWAKKAGVDLSSYNASMLQQLSSGGKVYALPFNAEPDVIFYNKKIFKEDGVPTPSLDWTTDDFVAAAKATTKNGVHGFAIGQGITTMAVLMAANGHSYVSKDGKANLDDPQLKKSFQFLVDLVRKDKVAKPLEASGGSFPDIDAFSSGQAAMEMEGLWDLQHEQQALGEDNLGVAVVPSANGHSHGFIAGSGFGMAKACGDKKAAFAAIKAMTSKKAQDVVAQKPGGIPGRADSMSTWIHTVGNSQLSDVVQSLLTNGASTTVPTNLNQLNTLMTKYEVNAFSGKSSVADVLQQVKAGANG